MSDVDSLLDATLDDIADLPVFAVYPAGAHRVLATFSLKDIEGHGACPELKFKLIETVELANSQDEKPEQGAESAALYMLDNEMGQGNFKNAARPFQEALKCASNRELIEQVTDIECVILTGVRKDKNDPDRLYLNVKEINLV